MARKLKGINIVDKKTYYIDEFRNFWCSGDTVKVFGNKGEFFYNGIINYFTIHYHSVTKVKSVYFNVSRIGEKQSATLPVKGYLGVTYIKDI